MVVLSSLLSLLRAQGRQSTITDNDDHVTPTASVPLGGRLCSTGRHMAS